MINFVRGQASDLAQVRRVHADCIPALDLAIAAGLPRDAVIRTTAPALARARVPGGRTADARFGAAEVFALEDASIALADICRTAFANPDHGLLAARLATLHFQPLLGRALALEMADFNESTLVLDMTSRADPGLAAMLKSPYRGLLDANPGLLVAEIALEDLPALEDPRHPDPPLSVRLRKSTIQALVYRLVRKVTDLVGWPSPRGIIGVLRENELVKETALSLALRGYRLEQMALPKPPGTPVAADLAASARALAGQVLPAFLETPVRQALAELFAQLLVDQVGRYEAALPLCRATAGSAKARGLRAVLSNRFNDPQLIAMSRALSEGGIPLCGFQHGVTVEINGRMRRYGAHYESAFCDLEIDFNARAAQHGNATAFRRGRAVSVGMPREYLRLSRRKSDGLPPIWYISTSIYVAHHGQLEGVTDDEKCRVELAILSEVLARIDRQVLYKPYPGHRFQDTDPVLEAARRTKNVTVHEERLDLRYLSGDAKLLITSRSYSTPSWCLMTGVPLAHIDWPDQTPLDLEARQAMEQAVFLFDGGDPALHEKLRAFLERPWADIEAEWAAKAPARAAFMTDYVSGPGKGAGARAAGLIEQRILEGAKP